MTGFYIVITHAGAEPMACEAHDAKDIRAAFGDVALCAATTLSALKRAGWTHESIWRPGDDPLEVEVSS